MNIIERINAAKWSTIWLFWIWMMLINIRLGLLGIERAIREARIEVRVQSGEVTP